MRPNDELPPPTEAALERVEELLTEEPVLSWRPALTEAVVARIRRRRLLDRLSLVAALLLIAAVVALGAQVVTAEPAVSEATGWLSDRLPAPPSASSLLESLAASFASLTGSAEGNGAALPLAIAALILIVALNGVVVARPLPARRRTR